jgi:uncharacterized protein (TIGR02996 family)
VTIKEAIYAAILREPDEDLHRLALADWLDEHDQPERAEFIRVQCELAKLESLQGSFGYWAVLRAKHATCCGCSDWCRLLRRERELFTATGYRPLLVEPLTAVELDQSSTIGHTHPYGREPVIGTIRRGFVAEVRCDLATLLGAACGECAGPDDGLFVVNAAGRCAACDGKKRTPGVGVGIFLAHPVERVALTDKRPADRTSVNGMWYWFIEEPHATTLAEARLPRQVFAALPGVGQHTIGMPYPTPSAANAALSAAVVSLLRVRAGVVKAEKPGPTAADIPMSFSGTLPPE